MADLAIDIGQSQARIRVVHRGHPGEDLAIDGFAYGSDLLDTIAQIVGQTSERLGLSTISAVAVGSTGLYGCVPAVDDLQSRLRSSVGTRFVVVADDAVTAYLGARGDEDGIVVATGTGMVGLARGPMGVARVDGAGGMIGDDGSGWWIGRQGLIAAISAADGRWHASPALLARLESRFGPVGTFPAQLAAQTSPVAVVASFAKDVADAARDGDAISARIWEQAGSYIGGVIAAGASRAGLEDDAEWTLIGRLSAAIDLLMPGLDSRLAAMLPQSRHVSPIGEPLDGVSRLLTIDTANYGPMVQTSYAA